MKKKFTAFITQARADSHPLKVPGLNQKIAAGEENSKKIQSSLMKNRDALFQLIHSMSRTEKRYFVLDARKSGKMASKYLKLFALLNGMETYDEEKLKKRFPKHLSTDKAYLYESILRSMRDYMSASSKAIQAKEKLMDARYLYERGLYEQCNQRLQAAKTIATELEDQFTLLEVNKEIYNTLFDSKSAVKPEHLQQLQEEKAKIVEAIDEELKYLDLYYRLLLEVFRDFKLQGPQQLEELEQRLPLHLLKPENKPVSAQALRRFYLCNAVYHHLKDDMEQVYHFSLKAVEWWDDYPCLKTEEFHRYIINVSNLVNTMYKTRHAPQAAGWLEKLKSEKSSKSYHNERVIFLKLSIGNLLYLLNGHQFKAAHKALPEIIEKMNKFSLKRSIVLCGNIATVNFLVGDFEACIEWTSHILKNIKTGSRQDIHRVIHIYRLISLFELAEIDQLDAALRSTQRYYDNIGLPAKAFEHQVLKRLKMVFRAPLYEVKKSLMELHAFLQTELNQSPSTLGAEELLIWTARRLNLSSRQVVKPDHPLSPNGAF